MEFVIIGVVTALNFIVIKLKVEKKRYQDATFDFVMLVVLASIFSGSYAGMVVAMVSSLVISFYLLLSPPNIAFKGLKTLKDKAEEVKYGKKPTDKDWEI